MTFVLPYVADNLLDLNFNAIALALNNSSGGGYTGFKEVNHPYTIDLDTDKGKLIVITDTINPDDTLAITPSVGTHQDFFCWVFNPSQTASCLLDTDDVNGFAGSQLIGPNSIALILAGDEDNFAGWFFQNGILPQAYPGQLGELNGGGTFNVIEGVAIYNLGGGGSGTTTTVTFTRPGQIFIGKLFKNSLAAFHLGGLTFTENNTGPGPIGGVVIAFANSALTPVVIYAAGGILA